MMSVVLIVLVVLLGTACWALIKRSKSRNLPEVQRKPSEVQRKPSEVQRKPSEVQIEPVKEPVNNAQETKNDVMTEVGHAFLMYADNFRGLYEPLYKASLGRISFERKKNVLLEWDIRMSNISQSQVPLKAWWATVAIGDDNYSDMELQSRAKDVIQMVELSGIIRDNRDVIKATEDTILYYETLDESRWKIGQSLRVGSPCWYLPCSPIRIIEKGYCELL